MESNDYNDPAVIGGCSVPVRVNRKSKAELTIVDISGIQIGSAGSCHNCRSLLPWRPRNNLWKLQWQ